MSMQGIINHIRDRASIVEVISDYVTLKHTGRNYMGLCPFHSGKTPSFTVSEEKGIFHCFGCNMDGNVFGFRMKVDQLSFSQALELVAKRYGITIKQRERDLIANSITGDCTQMECLTSHPRFHYRKYYSGKNRCKYCGLKFR